MKNMKKFITLCGFLVLGSIACGDVDIVKAEAINEQATDTSGYTITIPSDVDIDKDSGKGSFAVTGKVKAQSTIDVSIQSKNGYKLKDKYGELPYNIDKKSFSIDNSRSASDIPLNEEFNIVSKKNTRVSGYYTDSLTFDITSKKYEYRLDVNGSLDGGGAGDGTLSGYGIFDVYVDGKLVKKDADDFCQCIPYGSTWELKNIRGLDGYHYEESLKGPTKGIAGENIEWEGYWDELTDKTTICRSAYTTLKFYTNKLKINYYPNGAQKYNSSEENYTSSNNDFSIDPNNAYMIKEYKYNADFPQYGLDDADRFKRTGYTCNNMYLVGSSTSTVKVNAGSNVYAKSQDLAEAARVLSEFKKNDITINLYPDWTPIQSQLNLNANGGTFSDNSTFKTATDKLVYDSTANANISPYTPTRKGYDFDGWYTDETGGTKVYNADGSAVNGTQYWQNNVYQNLEGTNVLRGDAGQNMAEQLFYGNFQDNGYKGKVVDDGWINDSALNYGKCKKITITPAPNEDGSHRGTYSLVLDNYCNRVSQSIDILQNKKVMISFKIKSDSPMAFEYWGLECSSASCPYVLKTDSKWKTIVLRTIITNDMLLDYTPRSLAFYTTSSTGTYYIGDVSMVFDSDVELFAHWKKRVYSQGNVVNIEGKQYIVLDNNDGDKRLVISKDEICQKAFQSKVRSDGKPQNTYEGSEIDNYLENEWYNNLSSTMKSAIQLSKIKQSSYSKEKYSYTIDPSLSSKQETGYNGQVYNTLNRHVYLPSVSEIGYIVDLNNPESMKSFLSKYIWTRDSYQPTQNYVINLSPTSGNVVRDIPENAGNGIRPAFVIDLFEADATIVDTVHYK